MIDTRALPEPGPGVIAVWDQGSASAYQYLCRNEADPRLWEWREVISAPVAVDPAYRRPWSEWLPTVVGPIVEVV